MKTRLFLAGLCALLSAPSALAQMYEAPMAASFGYGLDAGFAVDGRLLQTDVEAISRLQNRDLGSALFFSEEDLQGLEITARRLPGGCPDCSVSPHSTGGVTIVSGTSIGEKDEFWRPEQSSADCGAILTGRAQARSADLNRCLEERRAAEERAFERGLDPHTIRALIERR